MCVCVCERFKQCVLVETHTIHNEYDYGYTHTHAHSNIYIYMTYLPNNTVTHRERMHGEFNGSSLGGAHLALCYYPTMWFRQQGLTYRLSNQNGSNRFSRNKILVTTKERYMLNEY